MGLSIICNGCGHKVAIPDDYPRNKMSCPQCGVILELPAGRKKREPAPAPRSATAGRAAPQPPRHPTVPRRPAPPRLSSRTTEELSPEVEEALFGADEATCARCGAALLGGKAGPCPRCAPPPPPETALQTKPGPPPSLASTPVVRQPPELGETSDNEEDGHPYGIAGGIPPHCSNCQKELEPGVTLCVHCGYDLQSGKKVAQTYEVVDRHWVAGWSYRHRFLFFVACQGFAVLGLGGAILADEIFVFLFSWLLFTAMTAFLLGSFDRVDLLRDARGKVRLTHTWHLGFLTRPTTTLRLRDFEGVTTGKDHDVDLMTWIVFGCFLIMGCLPGLLWYYFAIHRDSFFVAMTSSHGSVDRILYRGWNEERAHEIKAVVLDVMMVDRT